MALLTISMMIAEMEGEGTEREITVNVCRIGGVLGIGFPKGGASLGNLLSEGIRVTPTHTKGEVMCRARRNGTS